MPSESIALASLSAVIGSLVADVSSRFAEAVGGLPVPHDQMLSAIGLFAIVSMITAIGVAAARRQGVWGAGKTVLNGMAWGVVAAGFCELRSVDRSLTLLACAVIGVMAEVVVSRMYTWSREVEMATLGGFVRSMVLAALRIPEPPRPPTDHHDKEPES